MEHPANGLTDKQYAIGKLYEMKLMGVEEFLIQHARHIAIDLRGIKNVYALRGRVGKRPVVCLIKFPRHPFFPHTGEKAVLHPIHAYGGISYKMAIDIIEKYFWGLY